MALVGDSITEGCCCKGATIDWEAAARDAARRLGKEPEGGADGGGGGSGATGGSHGIMAAASGDDTAVVGTVAPMVGSVRPLVAAVEPQPDQPSTIN